MENAQQFWYDYAKDSICYDDLVRKLTEAYMERFELEQKHINNEDIDRLVEEEGISENEVRNAIEDWISEFFEKNLTRLWDYI